MAGSEPSTTRRRLIGAAAALPVAAFLPSPALSAAPPDRAEWDARLGDYLCLAEEAREAVESGWFAAANSRYDREIEALPGDAEALRAAAWERMAAAEDAYWERCTDPMQRAAVALALTPAPDIAAVRDKARAMRAVELHELDCMERDCFQVLEEDLGRLAGEAGAGSGPAGE